MAGILPPSPLAIKAEYGVHELEPGPKRTKMTGTGVYHPFLPGLYPPLAL